MVYECTDRRGVMHVHHLSDKLTAQEAMERLGVWQRPFRVMRYPTGRPDLAVTVQEMPR
jgi:hypothetical protein